MIIGYKCPFIEYDCWNMAKKIFENILTVIIIPMTIAIIIFEN